MGQEAEPALVRIGELSRRAGVSTHVLRAWEARYGLLRPERSSGGFRLYSGTDEARVRRMREHLAAGLAAAEAARAALAEAPPAGSPLREVRAGAPRTDGAGGPVTGTDHLAALRYGLRESLDELDEPAAQRTLDQLLADFTVETVVRDVLVPYLHDLGERWERGEASVAQEHFASHVVRDRLTGLARGWGDGQGPQAVLACPPGELHDMALMAFGVALRRAGWRVSYLGADTPVDALAHTAARLQAALVVLAATVPQRFAPHAAALSRLARRHPLAIAGAGAGSALAGQLGAQLLDADPVSAARTLRA